MSYLASLVLVQKGQYILEFGGTAEAFQDDPKSCSAHFIDGYGEVNEGGAKSPPL